MFQVPEPTQTRRASLGRVQILGEVGTWLVGLPWQLRAGRELSPGSQWKRKKNQQKFRVRIKVTNDTSLADSRYFLNISGGGRGGNRKARIQITASTVTSVSFESRRRNKSYLGQLTQLKGSQPSAHFLLHALNLLTSRHLSWRFPPQPEGPSLPGVALDSAEMWPLWPSGDQRKGRGDQAYVPGLKWSGQCILPGASLPQSHSRHSTPQFMNCEFLTAMGEVNRPDRQE